VLDTPPENALDLVHEAALSSQLSTLHSRPD